jgi:hypothetical protein
MLVFLWYLADKSLKNNFLPYLKWPALIFAMYFIGFDIYYNMEYNRIIEIDMVHDNGILYTHWDNNTNTTQETRLYAVQGYDRGVIFSYFKSEYELNSLFGGLLGPILLLCIFGLVTQTMMIIYNNYKNGGNNEN